MLRIKKKEINSFKNSSTMGEADASTHTKAELKYNTSSKESVKAYNEKHNTNNIQIDTNDNDSVITYKLYCVKSIKNAEENDFFIGYNGIEYLFSMNEDTRLLTKIIKKRLSNPSDLDERYQLDGLIKKELKYLLSTIDLKDFENTYNEFVEFEKSFLTEKAPEIKKQEIQLNNLNTNTSDSNINIQKEIVQKTPVHQIVTQQQVQVNTIDPNKLAEIEKLKLEISKQILEDKKNKSNINFRNTLLPKQRNENVLVTALREVGGSKVICCYGKHGTGKTWTIEKWSKDMEEYLNLPVNFFSFLCEKTMDKSDIVGTPLLKDDSFSYQKMAEAFLSAREGYLTVLLIDEFLRLKEKGVLFNLFGETHYKLDTGRQLEVVELLVNDLDGKPRTAHFCLIDKKDLNSDVILEQTNIRYLKNADDEVFKRLPIQKIKDRLALGEIPTLNRKDYKDYNLEVLKVSSFFTSEVIKAPIEKLTIVLATNVGKDYITHAAIDDDLAFLSRLHLVEMNTPSLNDYILKIEEELQKAKEKGYILWNNGSVDVDKEIKNVVKIANDVYSQLFKLIKQGSFSSESYFSYRNFEEFAHTICKQEKLTSETIRHCFLSQQKSIMPHLMTSNSRIATQSDLIAYTTVVNQATGYNSNQKPLNKENNKENPSEVKNAITR